MTPEEKAEEERERAAAEKEAEKAAAKKPVDVYVPATTWDGLEVVGGPVDRQEEWDAQHPFEGYVWLRHGTKAMPICNAKTILSDSWLRRILTPRRS